MKNKIKANVHSENINSNVNVTFKVQGDDGLISREASG